MWNISLTSNAAEPAITAAQGGWKFQVERAFTAYFQLHGSRAPNCLLARPGFFYGAPYHFTSVRHKGIYLRMCEEPADFPSQCFSSWEGKKSWDGLHFSFHGGALFRVMMRLLYQAESCGVQAPITPCSDVCPSLDFWNGNMSHSSVWGLPRSQLTIRSGRPVQFRMSKRERREKKSFPFNVTVV